MGGGQEIVMVGFGSPCLRVLCENLFATFAVKGF
jgi:hypothetical protein